MFQFKRWAGAMLAVIATMTLVSCNTKRTNLPLLTPATQVVVTDYTAITNKNPDAVTVWTVTDAQRVTRLAKLAGAQDSGWRDSNAANITSRTGIEMKFGGAGVNQIFAINPNGFNNSYLRAEGNLWSREDRVGPSTVIKLIPDAELDPLVADIRAVVKEVKPDATPRPTAATPGASPTVIK